MNGLLPIGVRQGTCRPLTVEESPPFKEEFFNRIFWRSKEGRLAPQGARFFLQPFSGNVTALSSELLSSLPPPLDFIVPLKRLDEPNRDEWQKMVQDALSQIEHGLLEKVVLARKTTFFLPYAPDPFRITASLAKKASGAALFCIEMGDGAFLGASPERLFRREKRNLFVDALAGTRKKGEQFLDKELREFQFVENYFRDSNICDELTFSPLRIYETANLQHLYTQGTGTLSPSISDLEILQKLHPTPALCGVPQKKAFDWIDASEPFRRDLYGGVLGWSSQEEADSTVCIRCCMIEGCKMHFYTGAGIVAGSDAGEEWEELETKLSLYEEIIQSKP